MSVHYERQRAKCLVRWREDGAQRARRFPTEDEAVTFDALVNPSGRVSQSAAHARRRAAAVERVATLDAERESRDGVYPYATNQGVRWRIVFRQSDGTLSSRRGFTSRTTAATARRRLQESVDRGEVKVSREDFATFWTPIGSGPPRLHDLRLASRSRYPWSQAPAPVLRCRHAREDRRGSRPRMAGFDDRARRGRRPGAQDGQQRPHVPLRGIQRGRPPRHHASQPRARTSPRGRSSEPRPSTCDERKSGPVGQLRLAYRRKAHVLGLTVVQQDDRDAGHDGGAGQPRHEVSRRPPRPHTSSCTPNGGSARRRPSSAH